MNQGFKILIWKSWDFRNKYVEFLFILVDYCKMLSSAANLVLVKLKIFLLLKANMLQRMMTFWVWYDLLMNRSFNELTILTSLIGRLRVGMLSYFDFQNQSFLALRRKPCPCWHCTIYYCLCTFRHNFNPSLCCLSPFNLSHVAISRPCCLSKFYLGIGPH